MSWLEATKLNSLENAFLMIDKQMKQDQSNHDYSKSVFVRTNYLVVTNQQDKEVVCFYNKDKDGVMHRFAIPLGHYEGAMRAYVCISEYVNMQTENTVERIMRKDPKNLTAMEALGSLLHSCKNDVLITIPVCVEDQCGLASKVMEFLIGAGEYYLQHKQVKI